MKRCLVLIGVAVGLLALAGCGSTAGRTAQTGSHLTAAKVRAQHRAVRKAHRKAHRRHKKAAHRAMVRQEERETVAEPPPEESECDPNYAGACLMPNASDYDCEGGSGNGPHYTGEVSVVGVDHYGLDADGDGVGCEPH